ncbi:MAG: ABC transporter permease [Candidatus Kapabacteria bacterium]|nr:ABC transporter permease [Ignavibacteria bacterium]MBK6761373.1 ABC transporter permease [Ignavibacteria bacterium]MBK7032402.1 ABC transporter permease [Ignavibacteria bacterium]MBK7577402.1 ABC transporter permease [Ignavibacteria bacterium]MBP6510942.1 ABC transporter permease [Candidatus Kapabacteria bacterium]
MITYLLRKILYTLLVLTGVVVVTFFIRPPGDPARVLLGQRADSASVAAMREQLGLDKPLPIQIGTYMVNLVQGDLGRSIATNRSVTETIIERLPATALLALTSIAIATVLGILLGVIAAWRPNTWIDTLTMSTSLLGISLPAFVVGLLFVLFFGVVLEWFPNSGYVDRGPEFLVLPMITLAIRPLSIIARVTRSSMLDVLGQDYVRTARAKGLSSRTVFLKHALRNALNPVVTTVSAWFAGLLAGTYFIEFIFNWPGIGLAAFNAIEKLDYPMIQGTVLFTAVVFVAVNTLADLVYGFIDPKVRLS